MKKQQKKIEPPQSNDHLDVADWLKLNKHKLPPPVVFAIENYLSVFEALTHSKSKASAILLRLRKAMGILPSSEKSNKSGDPIGTNNGSTQSRPKSRKQKLEHSLEESVRLAKWHRDMAKKQKFRGKKLQGKLDDIDDDIEFTPEERAELDLAHENYVKSLRLGGGADPAYEASSEAFMQGFNTEVLESEAVIDVDDAELNGKEVVNHLFEERARYDFNLVLEKKNLLVGKVVTKDEFGATSIISASTAAYGPARMDVTWGFLANMTMLVSQFGMPMNRLANMLSTPFKKFTSGSIARYYQFVAKKLAPIYLHEFKSICNSKILAGDDTSSHVVQHRNYYKNYDEKNPKPPPWQEYATLEVAAKKLINNDKSDLASYLASELGFVSGRKNSPGDKQSLQTTVLSGRSEPKDPRSQIIFYRTHIGGFGNLVSILLKNRHSELKDLVIQSDLATVNLVSDPELAAKFNITYAGCASHARRPFSIYRADDPELCEYILHAFKGLYIYERALDLHGRNAQNVKAVRETDSLAMWELIKEYAEIILKKWPKATSLGAAANYIIKNYDKLTAFIWNSSISVSNDFSERMIRMEKIIAANSLFRATLEGRFALDINRSILQTAIAANVNPQKYLMEILKIPDEELRKNPKKYTPYAYYKKKLLENSSAPK